MAQMTCVICGGTNLVMEEGVFVCKGCGAKYSVEEMRRMMNAPEPKPSDVVSRTVAKAAAVVSGAAKAGGLIMSRGAEFNPDHVAGINDPVVLANYATKAFGLLMDDYKALEHPLKERQGMLAARVREVLAILHRAALIDPNNHLQNLLIYKNCDKIVDKTTGTDYWEKNSEGEWKRRPFGLHDSDLKIPSQTESWEKLARREQDLVEVVWLDANPDLVQRRSELQGVADGLEAQIAELKDEKRSHGFFDFSGKREVKDRMKPIQDELAGINSQIRDIDRQMEGWVEENLRTLSATITRL